MAKLFRGDVCIVPRLQMATTWLARARGLLFREVLPRDGSEALLISPCGSIHTFGMKYSLDVVFIDSAGHVLAIRRNLTPRKVCFQRGAVGVIEFREGATQALGLAKGQCIRWST